MSRIKINRSIYERCLLTEVSPFETPLIYSNWGSYNYCQNLANKRQPPFLKEIMQTSSKWTIPYNYEYSKNNLKKRTLSLIHPGLSAKIIDLYKKHEILILRLMQKSLFSIRFPHSVARYYNTSEAKKDTLKEVEQLDENQAYASSFFAYMYYSHLHKYFESDAFTEIEKKFRNFDTII